MTDEFDARHRLATYGTLAPGRPNHVRMSGMDGRWLTGHVHGRLVEQGWGAELGFPALVLDPDAPAVDVDLFESVDLPDHWARLDHFEGPGYRRVPVQVHTDGGALDAQLYALRTVPPSS